MDKRHWLSVCVSIALALFGGLIAASAQQKVMFSAQSTAAQSTAPQTKPQTKPGEKPKPAGEQQNDQDQGKVGTFRTINVRLPVTITEGKSNRFVVDLKQSDFEILEDKTKQEIVSFQPLSDLPLDVAILMDTSNSVKPKLKFEKDAAVSFLQTMLTSRKDRALFATFDSEVELHQDFTNRLDLLTNAIDKVKAQGETRMYDAIYSVCEEKMFAIQGRRRAMVIITDGEDTISERALNDAIDIAQRSETVVFVISTKSGGFFGVEAGTVDRKEDKVLKQLAEDTGGRAFFTAKVIELERSFSAIAKELRSQYQISYSPTNENYDGRFRKIDVRLPGYKDYRIRAKAGYNAVPPRQTGVEANGKP
jgi:Ca-activated chloride channel family protein